MSKILFILRCYSGFEQSLINKKWNPSGAPTIAKILERVQNQEGNNILFFSKSNNCKLKAIKARKLKIQNLKLPIYLIQPKLFFFNSTKVGKLYTELCNLLFIIYYLIKLKPSLIYSDHANIFITSLIARYLNIRIVVRVMGVKDDMRDCLTSNTLYAKALKWSYRAPFSLVLATQDGAGSEIWMDKALSKNVPRKTLLNGVDKSIKDKVIKIKKNIYKIKTIITFIGRLEEDKAPDKFLEAFMIVRNKIPNKFHCFIIGSGSMRDKLNKIIVKENAVNDVSFYSDINHGHIYYLLGKTDIYVSLNRSGNFSNANIEAMSLGKAIIMPKSQVDKGIDIYTDYMITNNAVYRVKSSDEIDEISGAIITLHSDTDLRHKLESEIKLQANKFIYSWDKRIDWEFNLLCNLDSYNEDELNKFLERI